MTKSDHEVIAFNLLSKKTQKVNSLLNATYNVQKPDRKNCIKNLQENYVSTNLKMQTLIKSSNIENMIKSLFYCV